MTLPYSLSTVDICKAPTLPCHDPHFAVELSFNATMSSLTDVNSLLEFISYLLFIEDSNYFNGDIGSQMMQKLAPGVPLLVSILYLGLVFLVPRFVMSKREPLECKTAFMIWNFILSVFSIWGMIVTVPHVFNLLVNDLSSSSSSWFSGFRDYLCHESYSIYHQRHGYWMQLFILSKIPELLDTFFLVVRKKEIILLQWYHHVTVMLYCWHSGVVRASTGAFFSAMNFFIHGIMYTYFFLMCFKFCRPVVKKVAFAITFLQILQMIVGCFIAAVTVIELYFTERGQLGECQGLSQTNVLSSAVMYASYLVLFAIFFKQSYLSSKRSAKAKKA